MSTAHTVEQKLRKRIRDARYRYSNCGAIQKRIREWIREHKPERILREMS